MMATIRVGDLDLTPEQARELLPALVGFVNRNGMLDDYMRRIETSVDPKHECLWILLDTSYDHAKGVYYASMRCNTCWRHQRMDFHHNSSTHHEIYKLAKMNTGLDCYALHDTFTSFGMQMAAVFGDD